MGQCMIRNLAQYILSEVSPRSMYAGVNDAVCSLRLFNKPPSHTLILGLP